MNTELTRLGQQAWRGARQVGIRSKDEKWATGRWVTLKSGKRIFLSRGKGLRAEGTHALRVLRQQRRAGLNLAEQALTPAMVKRFRELVKAGRIRGMKLAADGTIAVDKQAVAETKARCSAGEKGLVAGLKKDVGITNPHALAKWMMKRKKKAKPGQE